MTYYAATHKKACLSVVAACVAVCVGLGVCVGSVAAVQSANVFWYVDETGVRDAWSSGVKGQGVTTAVLDDVIVMDHPGFAGADVTAKLVSPEGYSTCTADPASGPITLSVDEPALKAGQTQGIMTNHGTDMALYVVGNGQDYDGNKGIIGVAPQVKLLTYTTGVAGTDALGAASSYKCLSGDTEVGGTADSIRDAVDSGARIISMSYGFDWVSEDKLASFVYALAHGVVMISARDNVSTPGANDMVGEPNVNNYFPGIVTVNAVTAGGDLVNDAKDGNVAILSPGGRVAVHHMTSDRSLSDTGGGGTSVGAAVLNGFLALTMSRWPDATGNQVLQSLVRNTRENSTGQARLDSAHKRGFGTVSLPKLLATDPTQYPDINPILETMVTTSEQHSETQGMYSDHTDWEEGTWGHTEPFPYRIKVLRMSGLVGQEYERQKAAWARVEQCRADGGVDCMQYSATATAGAYQSGESNTQSSSVQKVGVPSWVLWSVGGGLVVVMAGIAFTVILVMRKRRKHTIPVMPVTPMGAPPMTAAPVNTMPAHPVPSSAPPSSAVSGSAVPMGAWTPTYAVQQPLPPQHPTPPSLNNSNNNP